MEKLTIISMFITAFATLVMAIATIAMAIFNKNLKNDSEDRWLYEWTRSTGEDFFTASRQVWRAYTRYMLMPHDLQGADMNSIIYEFSLSTPDNRENVTSFIFKYTDCPKVKHNALLGIISKAETSKYSGKDRLQLSKNEEEVYNEFKLLLERLYKYLNNLAIEKENESNQVLFNKLKSYNARNKISSESYKVKKISFYE